MVYNQQGLGGWGVTRVGQVVGPSPGPPPPPPRQVRGCPPHVIGGDRPDTGWAMGSRDTSRPGGGGGERGGGGTISPWSPGGGGGGTGWVLLAGRGPACREGLGSSLMAAINHPSLYCDDKSGHPMAARAAADQGQQEKGASVWRGLTSRGRGEGIRGCLLVACLCLITTCRLL